MGVMGARQGERWQFGNEDVEAALLARGIVLLTIEIGRQILKGGEIGNGFGTNGPTLAPH
jgi:hypothetical protein